MHLADRFAGYASSLNVSSDALYNALLADAEELPPNWDLQGRQVDAWIKFSTFFLILPRCRNEQPGDHERLHSPGPVRARGN